ncbi:PLP-dependent aminotransferase family protein [Paraburkholderia sp. MPAMCS5]|uniref:MocR-like pyridoxine biosynthesis transcription factor PdxR n=1 Tax=Paraburkholderia sp. MPAMCS5 TaxID=3112563 RepID=UPI002E173C58|nr:PLP-dependent aminotransferase family protein [Paraburkholderia sp. MPAMCS5]
MVANRPSRHTLPALVALEVDRVSGVPVFRQIAVQLRGKIVTHALLPGTRLPASRELARHLLVARNCVVEAYDELIAEGILEGRGRHGTFVAVSVPDVRAAADGPTWQPLLLQRVRHDEIRPAEGSVGASFDWRPGQACTRSLPLDVWRNACREAGRHLPPEGYGDPRGELGLRRAIADWIREHRSVYVTPDQIIVTHGTGHALHLAAQTLLRRGDLCATEDPGYAGAALAFLRSGALLRYTPVDAEGLVVDRIIEDSASPLLVHVTPAHQYPMGWRLSGSRRTALVELARTRAMLIIENEYDCEFHYTGTNHPPIFSYAPESTLLLNTFAKAVSPSLRLGFIVAPPVVAAALVAHIERERTHVSWPVQKVAETLLKSGELDRHLRRVRRHYGAMRDTIRQRLAQYADVITLAGEEGGLHVVIAGRENSFDRVLRAAMRSNGIVFNDVRDFAMLESAPRGFLLGYGHMDSEALTRSLDVFERCIRRIKHRDHPPR